MNTNQEIPLDDYLEEIPTPTPLTEADSGITLTTEQLTFYGLIIAAVVLFVLFIFLFFKFLLPSLAEYIGFLVGQFKKGQKNNN